MYLNHHGIEAVKIWNASVDESSDENLYYKVSSFQRTNMLEFPNYSLVSA
jgi:hypothetical protein